MLPAEEISVAPRTETPSIVALLNIMLRQRRTIFGFAFWLAVLVVAVTLILPRRYSAESALMPQGRKQGGAMSGLAAQLGLNLPISESGQSPTFYAYLLESRALLDAAVNTRYTYEWNGRKYAGTLAELYRARGDDDRARNDAAVRKLRTNVVANAVTRTGVVELRVKAEHAPLATQINARMLELVNTFNLRTLQSQAGAERRFAAARLAESARELKEAEDRLQRFSQSNRAWSNSPTLSIERERLEREIGRQTELYSTLSEAHEQAKLEEVRNTPVITVVAPPVEPVRPDSRQLFQKLLLALVGGVILGVLVAFARDTTQTKRTFSLPAELELSHLRAELARDLRQPWRFVMPTRTRRSERRAKAGS
jgi:uncharacterized protein involved in exopolysaccharide biosynthesis